MGPRSAAFAFAVLLSGWISNFFCREHQTETEALSCPSPDVYLDKISSSKRSIHEDRGSTSQSVFRRESNRMSVAKKLTSGKEAQAELSIRFWVSNKSLQTYTLFLVTLCSSYREAWVTEHCLIGMWQPELNHPYIISFLKCTWVQAQQAGQTQCLFQIWYEVVAQAT